MTVPSGPEIAGMPFGWGAVFGLINVLGLAGAFAAWIKNRPKMRELEKQADEKLRDDLITRVEKLETKLEQQRNDYEVRLDLERAQHGRDLAIMRHRMTNLDQCLTMLLTLIETDPTRAQDAAARVREMRERQALAEAAEKGAAAATQIDAAVIPLKQP